MTKRVSPGVVIALTITVLLWSSAFALIKSAGKTYAPGELALLRFTIAAAALGVASAVRGINRPRRLEFFWFALTGLLGIAIYHTLLNLGEHTVSAGTASLLINSSPVWTALLAAWLLKEKITFRIAAGIVVSLVGIALLATGKNIKIEPAALLILTSSVCHAFYVIIQKKHLTRFGALGFTFWTMCAGVLWLIPPFAVPTLARVLIAPPRATAEVAFLGIFPAAIAYMTFAYATIRMPASRVMTFICLSPAVALLIAWGYLGEIPTWISLLGGALALTGVIIVNTARHDPGPITAIEEG